jgi:hypothetical protein
VHAVAAVHDTAEKKAWSPLATEGVRWSLQARPFQRSMRGRPFALAPTAVHAAGAVHETPDRNPSRPLAPGVGWIDHRDPFQCSISTNGGVLGGLPYSPTAVQARADAHETPLSTLTGTPA